MRNLGLIHRQENSAVDSVHTVRGSIGYPAAGCRSSRPLCCWRRDLRRPMRSAGDHCSRVLREGGCQGWFGAPYPQCVSEHPCTPAPMAGTSGKISTCMQPWSPASKYSRPVLYIATPPPQCGPNPPQLTSASSLTFNSLVLHLVGDRLGTARKVQVPERRMTAPDHRSFANSGYAGAGHVITSPHLISCLYHKVPSNTYIHTSAPESATASLSRSSARRRATVCIHASHVLATCAPLRRCKPPFLHTMAGSTFNLSGSANMCNS